MCAMNRTWREMGCLTVLHSSISGFEEASNVIEEGIFTPYPNPTRESVSIKFDNGFIPESSDRLDLISPEGKLLSSWNGTDIQPTGITIDLLNYPAGNYLLNYSRGTQLISKQFSLTD